MHEPWFLWKVAIYSSIHFHTPDRLIKKNKVDRKLFWLLNKMKEKNTRKFFLKWLDKDRHTKTKKKKILTNIMENLRKASL